MMVSLMVWAEWEDCERERRLCALNGHRLCGASLRPQRWSPTLLEIGGLANAGDPFNLRAAHLASERAGQRA